MAVQFYEFERVDPPIPLWVQAEAVHMIEHAYDATKRTGQPCTKLVLTPGPIVVVVYGEPDKVARSLSSEHAPDKVGGSSTPRCSDGG